MRDSASRGTLAGQDMSMLRTGTFLTLLVLIAMASSVQGWDRGQVERFATLPPHDLKNQQAHPERSAWPEAVISPAPSARRCSERRSTVPFPEMIAA